MLGVFNCVFHFEAPGSSIFLLQFFETISTEDHIEMGGVLFKVINKVVLACLTCVLTLGGAMVGIIMGAIKGQTTETGLVCGAGVGALAGAITVVQLMDLMVNGEPFSKVALLSSLVNGNVFVEWVCPAVLKAYQWQISTMETSFRDISDIFQVNATNGLSQDCINNLPKYKFYPSHSLDINCSICLQDFKNGEAGRRLPSCTHSFHLQCIDEWLTRHASCPLCRREF